MILSVIIPTRNRANQLSVVLASLTNQTLAQDEFEVIVVDNGSTDKTKEVVELFNDKILNLRYFYEKNLGLHNGRHKGLKESIADILVFADDDIEAFTTWLEAIKNSFGNKKVVLVGGKCLPKYDTNPPWWIKHFWNNANETGMYLGYLSLINFGEKTKEINPFYVYGCNFSIRKNILLEANGFHPDGFPDELMIYRGDGESWIAKFIADKGYKAIYNPEASVYHITPSERLTIEYFCKRSFRQGISNSYSSIRYKINDKKYINGIFKRMIYKVIINLKIVLKNNKLSIRKNYNYYKISRIKKKIYLSYKKGYNFHKKNALKDPELMTWVNKTEYY